MTAVARAPAIDAAVARARGLVVVEQEAPPVPVERFLRLPIAVEGEDERALWDGGAEDEGGAGGVRGDGWAIAGRGVAARVDVRGANAAARARDQGRALLASIGAAASPAAGGDATPDSPEIRLIGGMAFDDGGADAAPWAAFGDASFVLPAWTYARRGERAIVRAVVPARDARSAATRAAAIARALEDGVGRGDAETGPTAANPPAANAAARANAEVRRVEMPEETWCAIVTRALARISAGELDKVVLARRGAITFARAPDLAACVADLARAEPACTRFAFERGDAWFVGATPELLVRVRGRDLATVALAGTAPRSTDAKTDDAARRSLLGSAKDRREHAFVVDGLRAALGGIASARDVVAPDAPHVRSLRAVHHLATPISARLDAPLHALDAARALHPSAAVCGAPRAPAIRFIRENEPDPRGWYASAVGWFDARGEGELAVALRSALVRGTTAYVYAGAGIVAGSDPAREYEETTWKRRSILAALGVAP